MTLNLNSWSSRLGVGHKANNLVPEKQIVQKCQNQASDKDRTFGKRPQLRHTELRFGTWNVRTLAMPGKLDILSEELEAYNMDLVALQETKWPFCGKLNSNSYQIMYSGCDDGRHYAGVGFAIKRHLLEAVVCFKALSERICYIRLRGKFNNISVVSFYAPTEDSKDEDKDMFYAQLEEAVSDVPHYDTLILLGDANAKIGKKEVWYKVAGKESLHEQSNDNGIRLLSFACSSNLCIASTKFPRKNIYKETWVSPDGHTTNQIDHILIDKRHLSSVTQVRSLRGAECGTDHYLVLAKVRQKLKIEKRNKNRVEDRMAFESNKLNEYQMELKNRFSVLLEETEDNVMTEQEVENTWTRLKTSIKESAKNVFSTKKAQKNPWFNEECRKLVEERKKARIKALTERTQETKERYKLFNKQVNKTLREEKRKYINDILVKAEQDCTQNNSRDFYRKVRFFQKGFKPTVVGVKDKNGKITSEPVEVLKTWKDYFSELLNCEESTVRGEGSENRERTNTREENIRYPEPTIEEIKATLKTFKSGKAPGEDAIPIELIKYGCEEVFKYLHKLITKVWKTEKMPKEWTEAIIVPLHKKGDKLDCKNYRGISLINTTYKILSKLLLNRLKDQVEEKIGDHQAGFMKGRSTTDQIFILKELASKYWEYGKDLFVLFIDFSKAYDSINREKLWALMKKYSVPEKLINLSKMCINESKGKVKVGKEYTDTFEINTGVRQGDGLSPLLFNIALEEALKKTRNTPGGAKIPEKINLLAFADDVALVAENKEELKELTKVLIKEAKEVGLQVNEDKTKYIKISRNEEEEDYLAVSNYKFKRTDLFKYLGVTIADNNQEETEIHTRLAAADRTYWSLTKLFKNKLLSRNTKIRIYKTIVQPVLLYGSEVWAFTKKSQKRLITFENKVLRRIFGPVKEGEEWRIRKNKELRELYKEPDIVGVVRSRRLRWLGHIQRRGEESMLKKILKGKPEGTRPLGRPRMRWNDEVNKDAGRMGAELEMAKDRRVWRRLVGEAKDQLGFQWPQE